MARRNRVPVQSRLQCSAANCRGTTIDSRSSTVFSKTTAARLSRRFFARNARTRRYKSLIRLEQTSRKQSRSELSARVLLEGLNAVEMDENSGVRWRATDRDHVVHDRVVARASGRYGHFRVGHARRYR